MSNGYTRYALAWVPDPDSPLARFGTDWTGWCADAGERRPRRLAERVRRGIELTTECARRGLHAPIIDPLVLPAGCSAMRLETVLARLTESAGVIRLPRLGLAIQGGRVVLTPTAATPALTRLIARARADLAAFEAPVAPVPAVAAIGAATPHPAPGPPERTDHGFHLPLSDPLARASAKALMARLAPQLSAILAERYRIESLALMGDPGRGRPLALLERFPLGDAAPGSGIHGMRALGPQLYAPLTEPAGSV